MDKDTFAKLIIDNEQQLYRIAKSILRSDEDCADAAQEAVARGFAGLHSLKQDRYAKTWLIRILIHECYRVAKERARNFPLEPEMRQEASGGGERYSELYEALSCLPEDFRVVMVMHYLEGYAVKEIAEILQIPDGTVKSRMSRGREQLRHLLEEGA
ncbi:MAG: sigma-70 family RNA polymerase sigma factor [Lachnospiraceae bacterium]|nr:sigma-70 family RNA polymerase sigma factor [Lachnospiraceae bacterium]